MNGHFRSQNRSDSDRESVASGLDQQSTPAAAAISQLMRKT
jgi:predicted FMN-binding regulatory protein PaiB